MPMPNFVLRATSQRLIAGAFSTVMLVGPAMGQEGTAVPDFSPNSRTGWIAGVPDGVSPVGQDFLQPPSGPGPVTFDKTHPYLDTAAARRAKAQPTLRVADLSNPILRPWVREELRKVNERPHRNRDVHAQRAVLADWGSGIPSISGNTRLFRANAEGGGTDLGGGSHGAPCVSDRQAFTDR